MAKETVGFRVPSDTLEGMEEYAEENGLSRSDAGRRLLEAGLEVEKGVATDGGEVLDRVDELKRQQHRVEREERIQNALLGGTLLAAVTVLSGAVNGPVPLFVAVVLALALIGWSLFPLLSSGGRDG